MKQKMNKQTNIQTNEQTNKQTDEPMYLLPYAFPCAYTKQKSVIQTCISFIIVARGFHTFLSQKSANEFMKLKYHTQ